MAQEGACATCRRHMLPQIDCTCALFTGRKPDAAGHRLDFSHKACAVVAFCFDLRVRVRESEAWPLWQGVRRRHRKDSREWSCEDLSPPWTARCFAPAPAGISEQRK